VALIAAITAVLALVSVFVRRRGAPAELRQQLAMADRLAALGGILRVTSAPGHGTQVTGRVPVAQDLPAPRREPAACYGR
jgi:signal transduction histidine kinase